jgi:hypothetical protein
LTSVFIKFLLFTTRRQYPARLKRFLDFVKIACSDLEAQCENFVNLAVRDPRQAFELIIEFLEFQNKRARKKEIEFGTVASYYKLTESV